MAKHTPTWREADYTPFFLIDEPVHTVKEIRAEYARLRDTLMKRANRLEQAGLTVQAKYLRETMPKLKGMDTAEVSQRLSKGHAIAGEHSYSLSGVKQLQKLYADEGAEINLGDVLSFSDFMKSWRTSAFTGIVAASDAKNVYDDYQEYGGSFSDFWTVYQEL